MRENLREREREIFSFFLSDVFIAVSLLSSLKRSHQPVQHGSELWLDGRCERRSLNEGDPLLALLCVAPLLYVTERDENNRTLYIGLSALSQ